MMMPANYSAIAEEELSYVAGGVDAASMLSTLGSNVWTIIGNTYISGLISSTLGALFNGTYKFGDVGSKITTAFFGSGNSGLGSVLQVVGIGAALSQFVSKDAKSVIVVTDSYGNRMDFSAAGAVGYDAL